MGRLLVALSMRQPGELESVSSRHSSFVLETYDKGLLNLPHGHSIVVVGSLMALRAAALPEPQIDVYYGFLGLSGDSYRVRARSGSKTEPPGGG